MSVNLKDIQITDPTSPNHKMVLSLVRLNNGSNKKNISSPLRFKSTSEFMPNDTIYFIQRKITDVYKLIDRYNGKKIKISMRFFIEDLNRSHKFLLLGVLLRYENEPPTNFIKDFKRTVPHFMHPEKIERCMSSMKEGKFTITLSKGLKPKSIATLAAFVNTFQIAYLVRYSQDLYRKNQKRSGIGSFLNGDLHIGQNLHGIDVFVNSPERCKLIGDLDFILSKILPTDLIIGNVISLIPQPIHIQELMENNPELVRVKNIKLVNTLCINILPIVISDLNLGLRLFTIWAKLLNRTIAPNVIITFLHAIRYSIKSGDTRKPFKSFTDIIKSVEIRSTMALDQFNEFFDTFLPILTNELFNTDRREVLENPGIVLVNTDGIPNRDIAIMSTLLLMLKDTGNLKAEVIVQDARRISEKFTPYSLFDYYRIKSAIIHNTSQQKNSTTPYDLEIIEDSTKGLLVFKQEKESCEIHPQSVVALAEEIPETTALCELPSYTSVLDLLLTEEKKEKVIHISESPIGDNEFLDKLRSEMDKWVILQLISPGEPLRQDDIFFAVGRYVSDIPQKLEELVGIERLLKRDELFSINSVSYHLLRSYKASMTDISKEYSDEIIASRGSAMTNLKWMQKKVREEGTQEQLIQWLKNLLHFIEINNISNIFFMKCVGLVAAIKNIGQMGDPDLATYTISQEIQRLIENIAEYLQDKMRERVEEKSEDFRIQQEEKEEADEDTPSEQYPEGEVEDQSSIESDIVIETDEESVFEENYGDEEYHSEEEEPEENPEEEELQEEFQEEFQEELKDTDSQEYAEPQMVEEESHFVDDLSPSYDGEIDVSKIAEKKNEVELVEEYSNQSSIDQSEFSSGTPAQSESGLETGINETRDKPEIQEIVLSKSTSPQNSLPNLPIPNLKIHSHTFTAGKNLKPNEIFIRGIPSKGIYPSGVLKWTKIETEVFIASPITFSEAVQKLDSQNYRSSDQMIEDFHYFANCADTGMQSTLLDQSDLNSELTMQKLPIVSSDKLGEEIDKSTGNLNEDAFESYGNSKKTKLKSSGNSNGKTIASNEFEKPVESEVQSSTEVDNDEENGTEVLHTIRKLDLSIPEGIIDEMNTFFFERLDENPSDVLRGALDKYFVKPILGSTSELDFEDIVLAITYAGGAEGVHISTTLLTNELPLNIKMWQDADSDKKKRLVISKIGEKFSRALSQFRYNQQFVNELSRRLR